MRVAVFGLGYVGTVTAACLADAGHSVVGIERMAAKVDAINAGLSPLFEPGLAEIIARTVAAGRLSASVAATEAADAEVALVCVGTPHRPDGSLELTQVEGVFAELQGVLNGREDDSHIVLRSTVPPGTTARLANEFFRDSRTRVEYCPEFLREGTAVRDFHHPPLTVVGSDRPGEPSIVSRVFAHLRGSCYVVPTGVAESVKLASNAFHALKVAFANEIARIFSAYGVDPTSVMDIFSQDTDLNISARYLRPGFAFGGACLPKDLRTLLALAADSNVDAPTLRSVLPSNTAHLELAVSAVRDTGARRVAILGLTFKSGTDDLRESPQVELARRLIGDGVDVVAYDPSIVVEELYGANLHAALTVVPDLGARLSPDVRTAVAGADLVVLSHLNDEGVAELARAAPTSILDIGNALASEQFLLISGVHSVAGLAW